MLACRIVTISSDHVFGQQLATALQDERRTVEVHQRLISLDTGTPPALCVIHFDGDVGGISSELLTSLTGTCPVIAVMPRADLVGVVDLMQSSARVAGMMVAEDFDPRQLFAMATCLLADDEFGLDKVMVPGTEIHSRVVGDFQDRSLCMSQIDQFVELAAVPRRYRGPIEQCIDEMLMNALYDAPVGAQGEHIFTGIPTRTRIEYRTEQSVVVQYACDGERFAVSVRDAFGSLDRKTVLRYLHKCMHAEEQIDRKAGGAGVGLYLMLNAATVVYFSVVPGIATEATCIFDLGPSKRQLEQFGFFTHRDSAGRLPTRPASRVLVARPLRKLVTWGLAMSAAVLVLLGVLAWPRLFGGRKMAHVTFTTLPRGAAIEVDGHTLAAAKDGTLSLGDLELGRDYPVVARLDGYEVKRAVVHPHAGENEVTIELAPLTTVELDSQPTGATVEIDGKPMGSTPLTLTTLVPGATVSIVFKRAGYRDATTSIQIPQAGGRRGVVQPLEVSDEFVLVHFVSNPPGAEIIETGKASTIDRTYTPADVFVKANQVQRFTLKMPKHVPVVIEPFTPPRGIKGLEKRGDLVEGSTLRIEATLPGKVTVSAAPHCTAVELPVSCTLAPGTYSVVYLGPDNAKVTHAVVVTAADAVEKLELGWIEAAPGKLLQPGGLQKAVFEAGARTVTVSDKSGRHPVTVTVKPSATVIAN